MNVPIIGQKQEIPWGVNIGIMPDGHISLVVSQGIMGIQAPLSLPQARELAQGLKDVIDKLENIRIASQITNGRVAS